MGNTDTPDPWGRRRDAAQASPFFRPTPVWPGRSFRLLRGLSRRPLVVVELGVMGNGVEGSMDMVNKACLMEREAA